MTHKAIKIQVSGIIFNVKEHDDDKIIEELTNWFKNVCDGYENVITLRNLEIEKLNRELKKNEAIPPL